MFASARRTLAGRTHLSRALTAPHCCRRILAIDATATFLRPLRLRGADLSLPTRTPCPGALSWLLGYCVAAAAAHAFSATPPLLPQHSPLGAKVACRPMRLVDLATRTRRSAMAHAPLSPLRALSAKPAVPRAPGTPHTVSALRLPPREWVCADPLRVCEWIPPDSNRSSPPCRSGDLPIDLGTRRWARQDLNLLIPKETVLQTAAARLLRRLPRSRDADSNRAHRATSAAHYQLCYPGKCGRRDLNSHCFCLEGRRHAVRRHPQKATERNRTSNLALTTRLRSRLRYGGTKPAARFGRATFSLPRRRSSQLSYTGN